MSGPIPPLPVPVPPIPSVTVSLPVPVPSVSLPGPSVPTDHIRNDRTHLADHPGRCARTRHHDPIANLAIRQRDDLALIGERIVDDDCTVLRRVCGTEHDLDIVLDDRS